MSDVQSRVQFFERLGAANTAVTARAKGAAPFDPAAAAAAAAATISSPEREKEARRASLSAAASNNAADNPRVKLMRRLGKIPAGSNNNASSVEQSSPSSPVPLLNFRPAKQNPAADALKSPESKPPAGKRSNTTGRFIPRSVSPDRSPAASAGQRSPAAVAPAASSKSSGGVGGAGKWRPPPRKGREDGDENDRDDSVPKEVPAWAHPVGTQKRAGSTSSLSASDQQQTSSIAADATIAAAFAEDEDSSDPCPVEVLWDMVLGSTVLKDNEIKLRRQVVLWECCERKLRSGSYIEAPFATGSDF